jgi:hypothetical protein
MTKIVTKINGIPVINTKVTGFTYNDSNLLTISNNDGISYSTTINQFSGLTVNGNTITNTISTPISFQTNDASETYTIDMSASNIILFSAGTSTACTLSYSGAVVGQYTLILDNSGTRIISLATGSGWYTNLGLNIITLGINYITACYDGSRLFITELESMNEV